MFPVRKAFITAGVVGSTLVGGAIGASLVGPAGAADTTSTTALANSSAAPAGQPPATFDPTRSGHVGANGTKEELLTGDTADKVKAAALAASPGATVQRVETDADTGSPYEAHIVKADGSPAIVYVDSTFKVTSVEDGPGPGGRHP